LKAFFHMFNLKVQCLRPMSKVKSQKSKVKRGDYQRWTLDKGLWTILQLFAQLESLHLPGCRVRQLRHK
jgi:hypothetical protein